MSRLLAAAVLVVGCLPIGSAPAAEPQRIALWNGRAPVGEGRVEKAEAWITVHRPRKTSGAAVVICPGGGYGTLVTGAEGHGIAAWLNRYGITGIVLEYRLPAGRTFVPLWDAQRALRTVRARAPEWGIDPARVGIMGFSAGGHLAATAGTHFDDGDPSAQDPVDRASCRPDFLILVYPVINMGETTHPRCRTNLLGKDPSLELAALFSSEKQVTARTPPAFLAHAQDDKVVPPEHSKLFYDALLSHRIPAQYLELPSGGHGLNGYKGPMWDAWQEKSLAWLAQRKIIPQVSEASSRAPMFLAVGSALRRVTSQDGIRWEHNQEVPGQARDDAYLLRGATHGEGLIVAVGQRILVSRDGREWTEASVQRNWLGDVAYGKGMFVAVGYQRSISSRDGTTWSAPVRNPTVSGRRIAFGGGRFVAIGWMTEQGQQVGYSTTTTDAQEWTNTKVAGGLIPRSVAFGNGRFVLVGSHGLRESSADGVTWQHRTLGEEAEELREVIWTGEQFVALGNRGGYASPDGIQWRLWSQRVPSQVCYGNGVFAGSSAGSFSYSKDGVQWTPVESESKTQIRKIIFVPGS
jgi:acetyl esterase/lipase